YITGGGRGYPTEVMVVVGHRRWACVHDTAILTRLRAALSCSVLPILVSNADKPLIRALLIASCLCLAATAAVAQDAPATPADTATATANSGGSAERGRVLAYTCQGCHGVTGYTNAYPNYQDRKSGVQRKEDSR